MQLLPDLRIDIDMGARCATVGSASNETAGTMNLHEGGAMSQPDGTDIPKLVAAGRMTKAAAIRELNARGMATADIARLLGLTYQHVYVTLGTANRGVGSGTSGTSSPAGRARARLAQRLAEIDAGFDRYLKVCAEQRIFTGPSEYFYDRTVEHVRGARDLTTLRDDDRFVELVYATLTSWGMHRMGAQVATKLTDFPTFRSAVQELLRLAHGLEAVSMLDLSQDQAARVVEQLRPAVEAPGISASQAPLVANAKTLHFMLPDLMPPIDRTYTLQFFYANMNPPRAPGRMFGEIYPHLVRLSRQHAASVRAAASGGYLCRGHAKAIDNAIVGYMLTHRAAAIQELGEDADLGG